MWLVAANPRGHQWWERKGQAERSDQQTVETLRDEDEHSVLPQVPCRRTQCLHMGGAYTAHGWNRGTLRSSGFLGAFRTQEEAGLERNSQINVNRLSFPQKARGASFSYSTYALPFLRIFEHLSPKVILKTSAFEFICCQR